MSDNPTPGDALAVQAFLYANGDLDGPAQAAFEDRLAVDQATRDALAQAVPLLSVLGGKLPPRPDPAYRQRVRDRLQGGWWRWLTGRRTYRGHPLLWTALGAAASLLLVLGWWRLTPAAVAAPGPVALQPTPETGTVAEPEYLVTTIEVAETWADLDHLEHLTKARDEEMRRKIRNTPTERGPGRVGLRDDRRGAPAIRAKTTP
jgi:hypothetical protein